MAKYNRGDHVELKNGKTGKVTFTDTARDQYVVEGDDGKEYYPRVSGIIGKYQPKKEKKGLFRRK